MIERYEAKEAKRSDCCCCSSRRAAAANPPVDEAEARAEDDDRSHRRTDLVVGIDRVVTAGMLVDQIVPLYRHTRRVEVVVGTLVVGCRSRQQCLANGRNESESGNDSSRFLTAPS